jgi:hypothetical protein
MSVRWICDLFLMLSSFFFNIRCCSERDFKFRTAARPTASGGALNIALGGELASYSARVCG